MKYHQLLTLLFLGHVACTGKEQATTQASPEAKKGLSISIPHKDYHPEQPLIITITNNSTAVLRYQKLYLERQEKDKWRLIRGNLRCPCLTDCKQDEIVLKPGQAKQHVFNHFYEVKEESLPHTVFCGMMRKADFRIGILGHDQTKPVNFHWDVERAD